MSFTWLDLVVALFIAAGAFRGFKRGLVREGMAFAGLAVGLLVATRWYGAVFALLRPFIGGGRPVEVLAYLLVMLAVLVCFTLLTVLLLRLRRLLFVGWLDRLGGTLFGGGQGALLAAAGLVLLIRNPVMGLDQAVRESEVAVGLLRAVSAALVNLPPILAPVAAFFRLPKMP